MESTQQGKDPTPIISPPPQTAEIPVSPPTAEQTTKKAETPKVPVPEEEIKETFKEMEYKVPEENDVRVAVIGNVDSGKSTLVGVLTKALLDDGRGYARSKVFNYSHEQQNGRTSSIAHEIMGFDNGLKQILPDKMIESKNKLWSMIASKSEKFVTFLDLCGHEKYLKTTMFGMVGLMPDYAMIIVGANMGVSRITKEHLGIALALKVPIIVVITKIDLSPADITQNTVKTITNLLKSMEKFPTLIKAETQIDEQVAFIDSDKTVPIFMVSNVTGDGINFLKLFLSKVKSRIKSNPLFKSPKDEVEFFVDGIYTPKGIGLVVAGTMLSGTVVVNDVLQLGPMKDGTFQLVAVRSIHHKRMQVSNAIAGQAVCFNIKAIKTKDVLTKDSFRKGMVLVAKSINPKISWEFEADVVILHHATTVQANYQAVVHCGVIRQACKVMWIDKEVLRTGDKGKVKFKFMYNPEYLHTGMTILFREGRTKGLGVISTILYPTK